MLRLISTLILLVLSFPALACWSLQGTYAIDGETYKFSNKIEHSKDYTFTAGPYHIKLQIKPQKGTKVVTISYEVQERKSNSLVLVTKGEEEDVDPARKTDIFAKGEQGQPNTILTLKLTQI